MKKIKKLLGTIWLYLIQIFFEDIPKKSKSVVVSMDFTHHYQNELEGCFLDSVLVAMNYRDIEEKIESYKYHSERNHRKYFVELLSQIVWDIDYDATQVALVSVPMHWSRYIFRGFDHMKYITVALSESVDIPSIEAISSSFSRRQSKLSRKKRLENRKNHFTMKYSWVLPELVILIDDVISTGSTANECAKVLKMHWVKKVIWVFLASNQ